MTPTRRTSLVVIIAAASLLLAGCTPGGKAVPSHSATEPSPTPTVSGPPSDERPPLSALVLTTEGLGTLKLGQTPLSTTDGVDMASFKADACAAQGLPGIWLSNYPDVDSGDGPIAPFAIDTADHSATGVLNRIDVNTPDIATDTGIALGSSLDAVLGVYPGGPDVVVNHADVSDVYVFKGVKGQLQFEVAVDRIPDYWAPAALNTVVFMSAIGIDVEPYGVAASDNTIGVCNNS